ncbi:MAG TPA: hypothetical protein PLP17_03740, partial [Oligoflexia bacterium]|nr:hypothetical protein [Oligoflexia bacterium]
MRKSYLITFVFLAFAAGVFSAALYQFVFAGLAPKPPPSPEMREKMREEYVSKFCSFFNLSSEQEKQVRAEFAQSEKKMLELHLRVAPRAMRIRRETQARIRSHLTAEQQIRFDEVTAKHRARMEKMVK